MFRPSLAVPGAQVDSAENHIDVLALNQALERLTAQGERRARIVELRFFGGLSVDEIAETLAASPTTVDREWALARAWLQAELSP